MSSAAVWCSPGLKFVFPDTSFFSCSIMTTQKRVTQLLKLNAFTENNLKIWTLFQRWLKEQLLYTVWWKLAGVFWGQLQYLGLKSPWNGIRNPLYFCKYAYFRLKQDIQVEKNVERELILFVRTFLDFEKWTLHARIEPDLNACLLKQYLNSYLVIGWVIQFSPTLNKSLHSLSERWEVKEWELDCVLKVGMKSIFLWHPIIPKCMLMILLWTNHPYGYFFVSLSLFLFFFDLVMFNHNVITQSSSLVTYAAPL